jgi:hypothetical protein
MPDEPTPAVRGIGTGCLAADHGVLRVGRQVVGAGQLVDRVRIFT